jgi:hypothetical protein
VLNLSRLKVAQEPLIRGGTFALIVLFGYELYLTANAYNLDVLYLPPAILVYKVAGIGGTTIFVHRLLEELGSRIGLTWIGDFSTANGVGGAVFVFLIVFSAAFTEASGWYILMQIFVCAMVGWVLSIIILSAKIVQRMLKNAGMITDEF